MQQWNDFVDWLTSDEGWRVISTAIIPFVAIVVAGVIGALIGRGSTRRLLAQQDRELQSSAVAAMIDAGRTATMWSSLAAGVQSHADAQFSAADIRLRLLPVAGSSAAADWATHELKAMRRDSAGFSFQAEQTFTEYRDRLLEWQRRPGRARKLFALDLERFQFEDSSADTELVEQQRRWAAEQAAVAQEQQLAEPAAAPVPVVVDPPRETADPFATPDEPTTPTDTATPADAATSDDSIAPESVAEPLPATEHVNEADHSDEHQPEIADAVVAVDASGAAEFMDGSTSSAPEPDAYGATEHEPADDSDDDHEAEQPDDGEYGPVEEAHLEPHVESEEDPADELEGVEIADPVEHPTEAVPLIEPERPAYQPVTSQFGAQERDADRD